MSCFKYSFDGLSPKFDSYKRLLVVIILKHINLVHTLTLYLFKILFNIISPIMLRSLKWSVSFIFSD